MAIATEWNFVEGYVSFCQYINQMRSLEFLAFTQHITILFQQASTKLGFFLGARSEGAANIVGSVFLKPQEG